MKFTTALVHLFLYGTGVFAVPTATVEKRAVTKCGTWDGIPSGTYTVWQNLWGKDSATSGSQCSTVNSFSGGSIAWSTSWTWAGGSYSVKSYANVEPTTFTVKKVSAISSIPSTWRWSYSGSNIVADVAYDLFTSSSAGGSNEYEIMIWLAALGGAGPISQSGSPISTPSIAGTSWKLYFGYNGSVKVYSFVASSQVTSFSGDLLGFLKYLQTNNGFPSSQYVKSIQAGTEPFTGSNAVLTTSAYSVTLN